MEKPFDAYKGDLPFIFVCYSHAEKDVVYPELAWLNEAGVKIWYDEGIRPGHEWTEELALSIENASHFLFFASPKSVDSKYCRDEVYFAIENEKPILTVHLEPTELTRGLKLSLGKTQAMMKYDMDESVYRDRLLGYLSQSEISERIAGVASTPPIEQNSIAVLPFANLSSDPENEYFSDGVTEEIMAVLVRTKSVPVIARTSSFQFKDTKEDIVDIGKKLGVTHILEGSVRRAGNAVRINAQLVDSRTRMDLWSDRYDGTLDDIFALQDSVAAAVVDNVQKHLELDSSPAVTEKARGTSVEAYDLFLRAESLKQEYTPETIEEALVYYEQSQALDPAFPDAFIGAAFAHYWQQVTIIAAETPKEAFGHMRSAIEHALTIEPENPRALFIEGYLVAAQQKRWKQGFAMMERALEMSPQDSEMLTIMGMILDSTRQPNSGEYLERAYRLDPLSIAAIYYAIHLFTHARQPDAEKILLPLLVNNQNNYFVSLWVGFTFLLQDKFDIADRHLENSREFLREENNPLRIAAFWRARLEGDEQAAARIGQDLLERARKERVPFILAPWSPADIVEIFDLLCEWDDIVLVGQLFQERPEPFTHEQWESLRERMNMAELLDTTVGGMFRVRDDDEKAELLQKQIEVTRDTLEAITGTYRGAYDLVFSIRDETLWLKCSIYGMEGPLVATEDNHYELVVEAIGFEFDFDDHNVPLGCRLFQGTVTREFTRVE